MFKFIRSPFLLPISAFSISGLSTQVFLFIIPVWLYELTERRELVSFASVISTSSIVIFGIISGVIIDRTSKKTITLFSSLAMLVLALFILIVPIQNPLTLYLLLFLFVICSRFNNNSQNTSMFLKFRKDDELLVKYNSYTSFVFTGLGIIYPLIGASLYKYYGIEGIAYVVIMGALITIFIYTNWKEETINGKAEKTKSDGVFTLLWQGLNYSFKDKQIFKYLSIFSVIIFGTAIFDAAAYIYIKEELGLGIQSFSHIILAEAIGGVVKSLFIFPRLQKNKRISNDQIIHFGLLFSSICLVMFVFKFPISYLLLLYD